MPDIPALPSRVAELAVQLAQPKPMRRGSLSVRYVKCNKPGCSCGERPEARHGPYTSVVRTVSARTKSRLVSSEQAPMLRQQVEAGQQFRRHVEEYWQACETWADTMLDADEAASTEAVKKRGSEKPSKRRRAPKSKR